MVLTLDILDCMGDGVARAFGLFLRRMTSYDGGSYEIRRQ
jgi:hypothetical protein